MARVGKRAGGPSRSSSAGRFRIIGGEWRGRRLALPQGVDVRPTPDRVRETLFNWLAPVIAGARCLDLYAGSGALGLEALSRGAAHVVFVDRAPVVTRQIAAYLDALHCERGATFCMDAMRYLERPPAPFDIVFLDPPYRGGLLDPALSKLFAAGWVAPAASVYLEHESGSAPPALPHGWRLFRSATAGQVRYHLLRPDPGPAEDS